jgi:CheY-like chemotaxis protein
VNRFRCPCGTKLKTSDETTGKRVVCPTCNTWLRVPRSDSYDTVARKSRRQGEQAGGRDAARAETRGRILVAMAPGPDRTWMETTLVERGYLVIFADDGPQAVERIRQDKPDAALVHVKLDGLSGFQVVQHVRDPMNPKNEAVWRMPIIMIADKLRGRDKQYAISIGANAFLAKPLTPATLCARLEKEVAKDTSHRP